MPFLSEPPGGGIGELADMIEDADLVGVRRDVVALLAAPAPAEQQAAAVQQPAPAPVAPAPAVPIAQSAIQPVAMSGATA